MEKSNVMALNIETFRHPGAGAGGAGGRTLFKALGHPQAAARGRALTARLAQNGPVAIYDPHDAAATVHAYYDLSQLQLAGYFVQRTEALEASALRTPAQPLTQIGKSGARTVFAPVFDAAALRTVSHLFPPDASVVTLDAMRIDDDLLTNPGHYLDPLNFATNFALLRDVAGGGNGDGNLHTRVTGVNYWGSYGAADPALWLCLFAADGAELACWREPLPGPGGLYVIDSREVRTRFGLGDFTGSLFMHAVGIAGHDVVKYALDTRGCGGLALSCTHDANAWPADYYAGVPAGGGDERVLLYVQNSHPAAIPAGSISVNAMGREEAQRHGEEIAPFATAVLDLSRMMPDLRFPDQMEIAAGRHFVRPRYEVVRGNGRRRIAHANVERTDLQPDPQLPSLPDVMGKGYIMPLPVLPRETFRSVMLPAPMARSQAELPVRAVLADANGRTVAERFLGRIPRARSQALDVDAWLRESGAVLEPGYGHVEFIYDFCDGGQGDGWLHVLGRYEQASSGHRAETIFGAHIYNTALTYKDEPQSYGGPPPGLTTRLFLRLGEPETQTFCHLLYPASLPWRPESQTALILHDGDGSAVAERQVRIPCGGSLFWRCAETFSAAERTCAGERAYVLVRDTTCRLFGFQGLLHGAESFCLDHMFGF